MNASSASPAPPTAAPTAAWVPVLPDSAPFTLEQRAYLNGYLAGLFSFARVPSPATALPTATPRLAPLTILYGSQTGTAEKLAKRVAKEASKHGFAPQVQDLAQVNPAQLAADSAVLFLTSTYGDGEPPDNAKGFWNALRADAAPRFANLRFSLCALGDTNYPRFCQFGKDLDARLEALGAQRVQPRTDCDVDYEKPFQTWLASSLAALGSGSEASSASGGSSPGSEPVDAEATTGWNRERPFPARLVTQRRLSAPESAKDVRHFEIHLGDSGLSYAAGDALGVWPENDPQLVEAVLQTLGAQGDEPVPGRAETTVPFREALRRHYELARIPTALLAALARRSGDATLTQLAAPGVNGELQAFLRGRDVLDVLAAHTAARLPPAEFVATLRKLQPRLYSISSSPKAHPGEVHLTVSAVRYASFGRSRGGVASTFLADRCTAETPVPVFVHENPAFRPPAGDTPLIMIGPGTGIAPFRAFLEDRRATASTGANWLFFGDQRAATDYLYREEIEGFRRDGYLARLDLAWSRDQAEKIYVQQRMLEAADVLWKWLNDGAALYVCGDASRMAKDVDAALHQVIQTAGGRTPEAAADYVLRMQAEHRYCRDVY